MIIKNNIIPFGGYKVINLFGLIFTKSDLTDKNHENIHSVQILECAIAFAILILFGLEWVWLAIPSGMDQSI